MPLPTNAGAKWPPEDCQRADRFYRVHSAWWSGEPDQLRSIYQVTNGLGGLIDPKAGVSATVSESNLLDRVSRYFWGNPPQPGSVRDPRNHLPLASDISMTSADLLFGEPPSLSVAPDEVGAAQTSAALGEMVEGGLVPALLEMAEISSALGGAYVRVSADPLISPTSPVFDVVPPDAAVPKWRGDRLVGVTFWRKLDEDADGRVLRHLECHDPGVVTHALYLGTSETVGSPVDLRAHPDTEAFAPEGYDPGAGGDVVAHRPTGAEWLTAEYFPNMKPNRLMRGSPLGRSDFAGIEPVMDNLDEVYSGMMRDFRLGKGRVVVPTSYLDTQGPGRGARFDPERELFSPINALPGDDTMSLEIVQFQIRVAEHLDGIRAIAASAVRSAGYSAQTFGETEASGQAVTATEVQAKEKRSYSTRSRKIRYVTPPLKRLLKAALEVGRSAGLAGFAEVVPQPIRVDFPDGVQVDEFTTSRTVQMLDAARAASTRTKVRLVNPSWSDDQVNEEVELIAGEGALDGAIDLESEPELAGVGAPAPSLDPSDADPAL